MPDPLWTSTLTYDAHELRVADALLAMSDGSGRGGRQGVRPGTGLGTTIAGTTLTVSTGSAIVSGPSGEGIYRVALDTAWVQAIAAAHATFTRIDLVYLRVWDTDLDGLGLRQVSPVYLAGTASGTPTAPSIPAGLYAVPLATVTVPPSGGGAATVSTAVRPYTVAPGGILPVLSAQLPAGGLIPGQMYYVTDLDKHVYDTGAAMVDLRPQGIGQQLYARKSSTTTITSDAVMDSDVHLTIPVAASATYILESQLVYSSDTTADIRIGWSLPSGAVLSWSCPGPPTTIASGSTQDTVKHSSLAAADQPSFGGAGTGTALVLRPGGLLRISSTAGACTLQWAQAASQAINTSLTSDSYLALRRVA